MSSEIEMRILLKSLQEEGIDVIYAPSPKTPAGKPNVLSSSQAKSPDPGSLKEKILNLKEQAEQCQLCTELASTRKNVVFGSGNIRAKLMFVGEAPGFDEDAQGLPFVGRAGQLLTKIIESIGLTRKQVFICNVLKCRPPGNRSPQTDEILNCNPYLKQQISMIQPRIICALGTFAAQTLLKTGQSISRLRGKKMPLPDFPDLSIDVIATYHPAYLLRNPSDKGKVWEDMKMIRRELQQLG